MRGGRSEDTSGGRDGKRLGRREGRGTKNGGGGRREAGSHSVPRSFQHTILTDRAQQRAPPTASWGAARGGRGAYTWEVAARGPGPVSPIYVYKDRHPLAHHSVHRVDNYKNMPPTPCGSSEM